MRLAYAMARGVNDDSINTRGFVILELDENRVGHFVRIQEDATPCADGEHAIKYFMRHSGLGIGAESYFFQEGHASAFEEAEYGGLRLTSDGESVLEGLYDKDFQLIKPE